MLGYGLNEIPLGRPETFKAADKVCAECGCLGVWHKKHRSTRNLVSARLKPESERDRTWLSCNSEKCWASFSRHKEVKFQESKELIFAEVDPEQPAPGWPGSLNLGCICPITDVPYRWASYYGYGYKKVVHKSCELHGLKTKGFLWDSVGKKWGEELKGAIKP